jgi:hypothetical protein
MITAKLNQSMTYFYNTMPDAIELIKNGPIDQMIEYSKNHYDIFSNNSGKLYNQMCDLIKARLDKEGLSHEIIRPDK